MNELFYSEDLIDHSLHPVFEGEISDPDQIIELENASCGDKIKLFLKYNSGKISSISFKASGCAISRASTDILCEKLNNASLINLKNILNDWKKIPELSGAIAMPNRVKCAALPWNAIDEILKNQNNY